MKSAYPNLFKPLLFSLDPELAHQISAGLLRWIANTPGGLPLLRSLFSFDPVHSLQKTISGLTFPNPVGLAAGFDKNAELVDAMAALGFGFVEVGTITPQPQAGNPRPRLFRLPADEAIINRMGFNNHGVETIARRLSKRKNHTMMVGGNIGKNKWTPNEVAHLDYLLCFNALFDYVDYFTINLSSPNTPGLRQLQEKEFLLNLLEPIQNLNQKRSVPKPVFLKIAPDVDMAQLGRMVSTCLELNLAGIVATNTTVSRSNLETAAPEVEKMGMGGLSGKPLAEKSEEIMKELVALSKGQLTVMSSGGIMKPEDAQKRLSMGADAIQLYSGLVYSGPGLVGSVLRQLRQGTLV